ELKDLYDKTDYAVRVAIAADKLLYEKQSETLDRKIPAFRYRYSFLARLILAGDPAQEYYTQIKNHLLSYRKVGSRISWNHEQFSAGRKKCARMKMKGKTLYLYLPLEANLQEEKYRLADVSGAADGGFPSLLRVRSERGVKYAKELIDAVMAAAGIEKNPAYQQADYHLPYATREELAKRVPPLVKIAGEQPSAADILPVGKPEEAQKSAEDEARSPSAPAQPLLRYRYSFLARFIQADENVQAAYGRIKNRILSYKNVKSATAWGHERFYYGRKTVMTLKIRGKSVLLFLALSPDDYVGTKYRIKDLTSEGKSPALPVSFKVRSSRSVKYAEDLIDDAMKKCGAEWEEERTVNYSRGYMSTEELLNLPEPLVKKIDSGVGISFQTAEGRKDRK
ncbi:MAG: hypothetical protein ACI4ST_02015, partial [Candidatus Gallimonas sp.]